MKYRLLTALLIAGFCRFSPAAAQGSSTDQLPVRGFCIAAPNPEGLDEFIGFIEKDLGPNGINTLILRVDYRYQYNTHPELRSENALTKQQVGRLVQACKKAGIRVIPQVNLLGHQSWASTLGNLLKVYPQFDETPHVELPEKYEWPNDDGLYCKSYCPLHPDVHQVVFDIMDEITAAFETDAFHAGLDEVFYIADDKCPRCGGKDPAELFAGEVTALRNHLAAKGKELWIWGDRLIDGKTTGIGMWEASMNNTYRAIDMIPKDVVICDWHYEQAVPTAPYFAMKGFRILSCPWRKGDVAREQVKSMLFYRSQSPQAMKENYYGVLQTVWTSAENFMDLYYGRKQEQAPERGDQAGCFRDMVDEMKR
ncbi:MAG: family 20 glycosylhydrolase [Lewinellaceae bacterium]|nr:family 20 glycosylhydrolase [Lewinella sp.]MCB9281869.1 family 20 glycosylhydrolase [Lewinellaceae bacterium]